MWILSRAKRVVGWALENPVLIAEGRVTMVDAILAAAVLVGVTLNAGLGLWPADPAAEPVIFAYAAKEGAEAIRHSRSL